MQDRPSESAKNNGYVMDVSHVRWHPNPVKTTFLLSDNDKAYLRSRCETQALDEIIDFIRSAHGESNLDRISTYVKYENTDLEENSHATMRVEELLASCIDALENQAHIGDCTCVPAGCLKCHTEELIGFSSIKGAGKHGLYKMGAAMDRFNNDFDAAIQSLRDYEPAANWLEAYRDAHFPKKPSPKKPERPKARLVTIGASLFGLRATGPTVREKP